MTDNVISMAAPKPLIFVCECGCSSFGLLSDGTTECHNCGAIDALQKGAWETHAPILRDDEAPDSFNDVTGNGSIEFARRRVARLASDDDCSLVVVAKSGGALHVWSEAEEAHQFEWCKEKLDAAMALIRRFKDG